MKYRKLSYLIALIFMLSLMVLSVGCGRDDKEGNTAESSSTQTKKGETEKRDNVVLEGKAKEIMEQMTIEEKIGQMFIVCTDSLDFYAETEITDTMKERLHNYQPGGVIFFSFNLKDREQTSTFIEDMQKEVKIPMFMGVDEEGGIVARIANNEKMGTTVFPSMQDIGATGDKTQAYNVGRTIGQEIKELGFNLDFAPVADVMTNEVNDEIGERSFGSDPDLVADMVKEEVKGLQEQGVSATLKHFPGQGSSTEDTHKGYADLPISIDELRKTDFVPFKKGIRAGADFVMVSHVAATEVTGNDLPASLSSIMVRDILRNELKFDNVIITDAMNMKSITKFFESDEAARLAIQAGNDMVLMPDDFIQAVEGIRSSVKNGKISEEEIDEAVLRILKVKIHRGIIPEEFAYFQ